MAEAGCRSTTFRDGRRSRGGPPLRGTPRRGRPVRHGCRKIEWRRQDAGARFQNDSQRGGGTPPTSDGVPGTPGVSRRYGEPRRARGRDTVDVGASRSRLRRRVPVRVALAPPGAGGVRASRCGWRTCVPVTVEFAPLAHGLSRAPRPCCYSRASLMLLFSRLALPLIRAPRSCCCSRASLMLYLARLALPVIRAPRPCRCSRSSPSLLFARLA